MALPDSVPNNYYGSIINHNITGNKKTIIFWNSPEGLSESISANYTQTSIPGASAPQVTYSATGARVVSFSIIIPFDYLPPGYKNIEEYLNCFKALVYPLYTNGLVKPPHCTLNIATISLDGVCTQCSIDRKTDRISKSGEMAATVSLSFMEVLENVNEVDTLYIANSTVNVYNQGSSRGGSSSNANSSSSSSSSSNSSSSTSDCEITILGNSIVALDTEYGLATLIEKNIWKPSAITYTNKETYTVLTYYGFCDKQISHIDNYYLDKVEKYVTSGSNKIYIQGSPFDSMQLPYIGEIDTYVIVHIPLRDGNDYDFKDAKTQYLQVRHN